MKAYCVKGLIASQKAIKKAGKNEKIAPEALEAFAHTYWVESPEEALQEAGRAIQGSGWVEGPTVTEDTEDKHMRAIGMPELPGLATAKAKKTSK